MTQSRLNFGRPPKPEKSLAKQREDFDTANLRNAQAFLANPALCGGREAFGYRWALMVLARLEQRRAA